jgi:hypothetical protein
MGNPPPRIDRLRVPESRCLNCHALMNSLGTGRRDVEASPSPGDVAVCIECGCVMKLDDRLRLRGMSEEEMDELTADREWMDRIASMVGKIHFLKHVRG